MEAQTAQASATSKAQTKWYVTKVIQEFDSKRDAEEWVNTHQLEADDILLKGKPAVAKQKVTLS